MEDFLTELKEIKKHWGKALEILNESNTETGDKILEKMNSKYPFSKSFDELYFEVLIWIEQFENLKEGQNDKV